MTASPLLMDKDARSSLFASTRVLLVDDSSTIRMIIKAVLDQLGITQVVQADNGQDAMEKLERFNPDLIILDIAMPHMDGLEFCERFRHSDHPRRTIPIIVMTGMEKSDQCMRAIRVGVSSILFKPIDPALLSERIYLHIQKVRLLDKLQSNLPIEQEDLEVAEHMQSMIIPSDEIILRCHEQLGLEINALYMPCELFGGDYWTVEILDEHRAAIFISDYSGHGISSAIHTFRLNNFLREYIRFYDTPADILEELNHALHNFLPVGSFLCGALAIIDTRANTLTYSGAGQPPLLLTHEQQVNILDCSGAPLGAYADAVYENNTVAFPTGSALTMYSDALVEINHEQKSLFTQASLIEFVTQCATHSDDAIYTRIIEKINVSGHFFNDDLTMVSIARNAND